MLLTDHCLCSFEMGLRCLPKIFKIMSLLKENKGIEWSQQLIAGNLENEFDPFVDPKYL